MNDKFKTYSEKAFPEYKKKIDPFLSLAYRPFSLRMSYGLIDTRITPNQITIVQIVIGLLGCLVIYIGQSLSMFLLGLVMLHFAYVLDCVDGEIARVRGTESLVGIFLDKYAHAVTMPAIFLSVGAFLSREIDSVFVSQMVMIASWGASFATFNPASRLVQTVVDALWRKSENEQYAVANYEKTDAGEQSNASQSRQARLLEEIKNAMQNNGETKGFLYIVLHAFRHVSYLALVSILLIMLALGVSSVVTAFLWSLVCIMVIGKEVAHFTLVVFSKTIASRYEEYCKIAEKRS